MLIKTRRISALLLGLNLLFVQQAHSDQISAIDAAALYGDETTYSITRKGKDIGQHSLRIIVQNSRIDVAVDSNIKVTVLKIPVFKFHYESTELWENNQLVKVDSTTTTNKTVETASLTNDADSSSLNYNNQSSTTELIQYPTNHWNINAVTQTAVFNTVKGIRSEVTVTRVGQEVISIGDVDINATHYVYSGDIKAETWYDEQQRWIKLAFLGSDGSPIEYLIDNP